MTHWVCRFDGSIQCSDATGQSLAAARAELAAVVGGDNVLNERRFSVPMIQLCGMPTGVTNAFELTEFGYWLLYRGFVGTLGFRDCDPEAKLRTVRGIVADSNFGELVEQSRVTAAAANPVLVRELIGHPVRVYEQGNVLQGDYVSDRVNVETRGGRITNIWFG